MAGTLKEINQNAAPLTGDSSVLHVRDTLQDTGQKFNLTPYTVSKRNSAGEIPLMTEL